jgi:hypothetical protein
MIFWISVAVISLIIGLVVIFFLLNGDDSDGGDDSDDVNTGAITIEAPSQGLSARLNISASWATGDIPCPALNCEGIIYVIPVASPKIAYVTLTPFFSGGRPAWVVNQTDYQGGGGVIITPNIQTVTIENGKPITFALQKQGGSTPQLKSFNFGLKVTTPDGNYTSADRTFAVLYQ